MSEEIPAWALERARMLCDSECEEQFASNAFARYIMKHEQAPVDPDVLAVREILAAGDHPTVADGHVAGFYDQSERFQATLAAYRKHKEAGK